MGVRFGYIERATLPELGLVGLAAKVDTGAKTSALHVHATRPAGRGVDPSRLSVVLPAGPGGKRRRLELEVVDWIVVLDTSGRRERRPVIKTVLELGRLRRTIRIGLTDRGQMSCPLLIGRTALPRGAVVDPHARHLVGESARADVDIPRISSKI